MAGTLSVPGGGGLISTGLSFFLANKRMKQERELEANRQQGLADRQQANIDAQNNVNLMNFGVETVGRDALFHSPEAQAMIWPSYVAMGGDPATVPLDTTIGAFTASEELANIQAGLGVTAIEGMGPEQQAAVGQAAAYGITGQTPSEVKVRETGAAADVLALEGMLGPDVAPAVRNTRLTQRGYQLLEISEPITIDGQTFLDPQSAGLYIAGKRLNTERRRVTVMEEGLEQRLTEWDYTVDAANIATIQEAGIPYGYVWTKGQVATMLRTKSPEEIFELAFTTPSAVYAPGPQVPGTVQVNRSNIAMAQAIVMGGMSEAGKLMGILEQLGPTGEAIALEIDAYRFASDLSPSERDKKVQGWLKALREAAEAQGKGYLVADYDDPNTWDRIGFYLDRVTGFQEHRFNELLDGEQSTQTGPAVDVTPTSGLDDGSREPTPPDENGKPPFTERDKLIAGAVHRVLNAESTIDAEVSNLGLTPAERQALVNLTSGTSQ